MMSRVVGMQEAARFATRWRREVAVALQRRKVAMLRAAIPPPPALIRWLGSGEEEWGAAGRTLMPLPED